MTVDPSIMIEVIATVMVAVGGGMITYLRSMAQSLKGIEIHVATLSTRVEFIEGAMPNGKHVEHHN